MNKFSTVIIGGGLSALTCGIKLAKHGQRVAIFVTKASTLRINPGAMRLLGQIGGETVVSPLDAIAGLCPEHPYRKIGAGQVDVWAREARHLLADADVRMDGRPDRNHFALSPFGVPRPVWLSYGNIARSDNPDRLPWKEVLLIVPKGFIDFPANSVAERIRNLGTKVNFAEIDTPALASARRTASGMRTVQLARVLSMPKHSSELVEAIETAIGGSRAMALMPAIVALDNSDTQMRLNSRFGKNLRFIPTMPPSIAGEHIAASMRHYFSMLGGAFYQAETISRLTVDDGRVVAVSSQQRPDRQVVARHFVLATGSLGTGGLISNGRSAVEPLLGLDTALNLHTDVPNPFAGLGVLTDDDFHPLLGGKPVANLFAIGSILPRDVNASGDDSGVEIITGLAVADKILKNS